MIKVRPNDLLRIDGVVYKQIEATIENIEEGDLVFDTKDSTYGYVDMKIKDKIAIKFGCVTELGIPINRVRKLIPTISYTQTN